MAKTQQLQIRVSATQKAQIQARAKRAGEDVSKWVLRQLLPEVQERFQNLVGNLKVDTDSRSYALAELNDFFDSLSARQLLKAVELPPSVRLSAFSSNYLAAMIEFCCVSRSVDPPAWLVHVKPLEEPWFASSIVALRLHLLTQSPPAFRRRNLFIDSTIGDRI